MGNKNTPPTRDNMYALIYPSPTYVKFTILYKFYGLNS